MDVVVALRAALPAEHEALSAIARAAKAHWGYPAEWLELWRDDLAISAERIARGGVVCAARGAEPVGWAALDASADPAELEALWVHPAVMGLGIGRRLFARIAADARALGTSRLRVESDPNAEAFYLRMGARRVGDVPSLPAGRRLPVLDLAFAPTDRSRR
jgi:GNAT superfamily N-acetyltransferase